MKRMTMALMLLLVMAPGAEAHSNARLSAGGFYAPLAHHGEWISFEPGFHVWRPRFVYDGWRPYTVGRWVWTEDGWYWVSGEPWGWATYHYGRWYYDDYYGWVWIPGNEWAPAWVEWRYGGGCVGWAPLGPYAIFTIGVGIHYRHHWNSPAFYWSFVDNRYITHENVQKHVRRSEGNTRDFGRTRSIGSVRSTGGRITGGGPDPREVERSARIRVEKTEIVDVDARGVDRVVRSQNDRARVEVYRPKIESRDQQREVDFERRSIKEPRRTSPEAPRYDADAGKRKKGDDQRRNPEPRLDEKNRPEPREVDRVHPPVVRRNTDSERESRTKGESREGKKDSHHGPQSSKGRPIR